MIDVRTDFVGISEIPKGFRKQKEGTNTRQEIESDGEPKICAIVVCDEDHEKRVLGEEELSIVNQFTYRGVDIFKLSLGRTDKLTTGEGRAQIGKMDDKETSMSIQG